MQIDGEYYRLKNPKTISIEKSTNFKNGSLILLVRDL